MNGGEKANLVLEDGTVFSGMGYGIENEIAGKIIFNTGVVGYQEVITDPANAGKIIVFTYPLIGNYGVSSKFNESDKVWCSGIVIKEKSRIFSNWQAEESLDCFLAKNKVASFTNVDTRTLMVHLREKGEMWGIIGSSRISVSELLNRLADFRNKKTSFLERISVKEKKILKKKNAKINVGILDLGITKNIISQWENLGVNVILLPYNTSGEELRELKLNGLIISNGPEEDVMLEEVVKNTEYLIGKIPLLGISTGLHVLAKALGIKIGRMSLGHRGLNYPIIRVGSYRGTITVQNHLCVIDKADLEKRKELKITAYNLNDQTVEEIESKKLKIIGVQYYPVDLGFGEINPVFNKFLEMIRR